MPLTPFDPAAAATVASWARSEAEALAWCSYADVLVPAAVVAGWSEPSDVDAYLLVDGGRFVGYGELWVDDEEGEVELAHLIVDPERRGQGNGRQMVTELVALARQQHATVTVRVRPDNGAALRCYAAVGFAPVDADEAAAWNVGQPVPYTWMTHRG